MPRLRSRSAVASLAGLAVLAGGVGSAGWSTARSAASAGEAAARLTAGAGTVAGELSPGGAVTGSLVLTSTGREQVALVSGSFGPATTAAEGCSPTSAVFALTVEPSRSTPLRVPAAGSTGGSTVALGWTAFLDGDAEDACQGARFTSPLTLDGRHAGTATAVARSLSAPGRPVGGLTTRTRAAVRWTAAPDLPTVAYVVERAPEGTTSWTPACRSSAAAPLRTLACTDTGLEPGTAYVYRASSVLGAWRAVGPASRAVTTRKG